MVGRSNAAVMRIKSVSLTVLIITCCLMPLVLLEAVRFWFFNENLGAQLAAYFSRPVSLQNLCVWCRYVLALFGFAPFALAGWGGWFVIRLFSEFRSGRYFTVQAAQYVRSIGVIMAFTPVLLMIASLMISILLSIWGGFDSYAVSLIFRPYYFLFIVTGGLICALGWVLLDAVRLSEENEQFI
ncbi:hypothetical protein DMO17_18670 [Aquipseudomonas alcaligenes]|uniref:DUF2975 domain-containing protein n=1 Tax=Aquipseudomonas alcaligenes TaxID=43263 RepID=A0A2V4KSX5_AQUAC|nr:DUF2975 domain-containing protein [Pseudomonas alcaligenes]PYC20222.1 hypothetical protein DMO17_18670 [Pseudomonas alcaligenes]